MSRPPAFVPARRTFVQSAAPSLRGSILALLCLPFAVATPTFAGEPGPAASPAKSDAAPARRAFQVTFKTKIPAAPAGAKRLEAWIPTPYVDSVQTVRDLVVTASVPYETTKDPAYGNRFVHVVVENPKGEVTVDWTAVVERSEDRGQNAGSARPEDLGADVLAPVDGRAKALAESIGATNASLPVRERAKAIYDHVLQSMAYDKVEPGWGRGDFERACEVGKGNCSDFTSKFIAIARAAGIPARWSSSISMSGDHMDCSACGYHCFAHYLEDGRWVPVDPSDARRIVAKDPRKAAWYFGHAESNSIVLSVGRDLALAPKQQAGPVNFLSGPYVEVDGKPFEVPSANRTYGHEPVKGAEASGTSEDGATSPPRKESETHTK